MDRHTHQEREARLAKFFASEAFHEVVNSAFYSYDRDKSMSIGLNEIAEILGDVWKGERAVLAVAVEDEVDVFVTYSRLLAIYVPGLASVLPNMSTETLPPTIEEAEAVLRSFDFFQSDDSLDKDEFELFMQQIMRSVMHADELLHYTVH